MRRIYLLSARNCKSFDVPPLDRCAAAVAAAAVTLHSSCNPYCWSMPSRNEPSREPAYVQMSIAQVQPILLIYLWTMSCAKSINGLGQNGFSNGPISRTFDSKRVTRCAFSLSFSRSISFCKSVGRGIRSHKVNNKLIHASLHAHTGKRRHYKFSIVRHCVHVCVCVCVLGLSKQNKTLHTTNENHDNKTESQKKLWCY